MICSLSLQADGVIIPIPPPHIPPTAKMYMELKNHYVQIDIVNHLCRVEVEETFYNPYDFQMEGEYIFPLPKGAMPSKFALVINGKEIEGQVLEKDEARKIYEDIVRRMLDPALLEYYKENLFRAKVFPILPKEDKKIIFRYEYELPRKGEFYEVFYPFKIEGLSPTPIKNVVISFDIKDENHIKQVFSPTHKIDFSKEEKEVKGAYEATDVKPQKDFILYYSSSQEDFTLSLLTYKSEDEEGFFLLGLSTPSKAPEKEVLPKDVVFVLDVSGSMSGEKIKQAKEGLKFFVEHLNSTDNFNIVAFSSDVNPFKKELAPAREENITEAKDFIISLEATGGTNIDDALGQGLLMLKESDRPAYLIFLTDGLPTVGVTSDENIIDNVKESHTTQRIFSFGVGYDVNTLLLDGIAKEAKGLSEYIEPGEDLEIAISSFYSKIMYPALENPKVEFENINTYKLHPSEIGDLFYGQDIIIAGRYKEAAEAQVILKGKKKDIDLVIEKCFEFPRKNEEFDFIPIIWARKRIAFLLTEIRLHGENKEVVDEIVELGKRYGIVTPYTSYLVTEEERANITLGVNEDALRFTSGEGAVQIAKKLGDMEHSVIAEAPRVESIKQIGLKTFYLKEDIYIDNEYTEEMEIKEVKFSSPEYFEILKKYPEYAKYFAVGERVIVVINGTAYKVVAGN